MTKIQPFLGNEIQSMHNQRIQVLHFPTIHLHRSLKQQSSYSSHPKKTKKSSQIRLKRKGKTLKDTTLRKNEFTFGKIHREYGIFVTGYLSRANVEQILLQILCQIDGPIRLEVTKRPDCLKKSPGGRLGILAIAIHFLHICSNPSITATLQSCRNSGITLNLGFAKLGEFDLMGGFCER